MYAIACTWIVEQINNKLCKDDGEWKNFIAVFDAPGLYGRESYAEANDFWRLLTNYGSTVIAEFMTKKMFDESESKIFEDEGLGFVPRVFSASKTALELFDDSSSVRVGGGLFSFFDSLVRNTTRVEHPSSEQVLEDMTKEFAFSSAFISLKGDGNAFGVRHDSECLIEYSVDDMCERNSDVVQDDFVSMVSGHGEMDGSINKFFKSLVADHEEGVGSPALKRAPSVKNKLMKKVKIEGVKANVETVSGIYRKELGEIMDALNETRSWFVMHIKAASQESNFDAEFIKAQVSGIDFKLLRENPRSKFSAWVSMVEFDKRYGDSLNANLRVCAPGSVLVPGETLKVGLGRALGEGKGWTEDQFRIGTTCVFMSEKVWWEMEYILKENRRLMNNAGSDSASVRSSSVFGGDDMVSYISDNESHFSEDFVSRRPSVEIELGKMSRGKGGEKNPLVDIQKPKKTVRRKQWLCCVWSVSWCIPGFALSLCGRMKRKDIQLAWREKVALCFIIFLMNASILFVIGGLGWILCPPLDVLSPGEVQESQSLNSGSMVHMYGYYYNVGTAMKKHVTKGWAAELVLEETTLGLGMIIF